MRRFIYKVLCAGACCGLYISCTNVSLNETGETPVIPYDKIEPNSPALKDNYISPYEYVEWVKNPEHNLNRTKEINEFTFTLLNKPLDYIISIDQRKESITGSEYTKLKNEFGDLMYFDFTIEAAKAPTELLKYKVSGEAEYQRRVTYFSYEMQKDFSLIDDLDTLPCILFHYERTYDIVPYGKVLLGFNPLKNISGKTFEFMYHDKVFNNGYIKFTIRKSDLENIPKLKTV